VGESPAARGSRPSSGETGRFSDFFHSIFGQAAGTPRGGTPQKGSDIEQPIQVSIEEAATGSVRIFNISGQDRCGKCLGTGESPPGNECQNCHGTGSASYRRRIELKVPAGAHDGLRIRVPREGNAGINGGEKGDLFFVVAMKPHPLYRREQDDLHIDVDVPYLRLILGGEVGVSTLTGTAQLTIPPHTQNGRTFRLSGKGLPHLKASGTGDLYAHLRAVLPSRTSGAEREHYEALDRLAT
jgi:DnaJ-class molecular chaperone